MKRKLGLSIIMSNEKLEKEKNNKDKDNEVLENNLDHNKLLMDWHFRVIRSQRLNYIAANYYIKLHYIIGIVAIILNAIVTSVLFYLGMDKYNILYGVFSILCTILVSLQTFFKFEEKAEKHKVTSAGYASVKRKIESIVVQSEMLIKELMHQEELIKEEMDRLAHEAPYIPVFLENRVEKRLKDIENDYFQKICKERIDKHKKI